MNEKQRRVSGFGRVLNSIATGVAGAALVYSGIRFSLLHWIVDVPAWIVSQFLPINFHEGDGAAGFFLSMFLSWLLASAAIWVAVAALRRLVK